MITVSLLGHHRRGSRADHLRHAFLHLGPLTLFKVSQNDADPRHSVSKRSPKGIEGAQRGYCVAHMRGLRFSTPFWDDNKEPGLRTEAASRLLLENLLRLSAAN